jgi:hypothetical protein
MGARKLKDLKLSDLISSSWVNFAKKGDPKGPGFAKRPDFYENDSKGMVFDATPCAWCQHPLPPADHNFQPAADAARRSTNYCAALAFGFP